MAGTFRLIDSFPPAGTNDVPRVEAGLIQLRFSQDVVSNLALWKHNKAQIAAFRNLLGVPIKVTRNLACPTFIFVVIKDTLYQNTHYKVVVYPDFTSITGQKLGVTEVVYYNTGPVVTFPV